ncbi:hypothetical protein [Clostridium sp.]|uniref:hypothetical protein n=1 Tax=Clostridium sp. TaxID=1506 RepID=UPI002FCBC5AF
MFNFQKEVVLNSLKNAEIVPAGGDTKGGKPNIDKKLRIHDGGEYFAKYIVDNKVYKTTPIDGVNAEVTINTAPLAGKHVQILIELGLDRDYRGDFGSALWYFRKPIMIDVEVPAGVTNGGVVGYKEATDLLVKAFKTVVPKEYQFVTVKANGEVGVDIKCSDSYMKVRKIVISEFVCDNRCSGNSEEADELMLFYGTKTPNAEQAVFIEYTRNKVEFGTYDYMIHNLRLPTYENLRFTSPSVVEMPVLGAKYVQYSFAYCVPRVGFGGMGVAGQTNHSTTMHTFFVQEGLMSKFDELISDATKGIGVDIINIINLSDADRITILPDAYASSKDLKAAKDVAANKKAIDDNARADAAEKTRVNAALAQKVDKA